MGKEYKIGDLARRAGVNIQTVLYYERQKLLMPVGRKESGYRFYNEELLKRLRFIRHAKELGFTLEEIRELLDLRVESAVSCDRVKEKAMGKLKAVEQKMKTLRAVEKILKELVDACEKRSSTEECPVLKAIEEEEIKTERR